VAEEGRRAVRSGVVAGLTLVLGAAGLASAAGEKAVPAKLARASVHFEQNATDGDVEVVFIGGEAPGRVDPDHPFVKLVVEAAKGIYEHDMLVVPMIGGSGPNHAFIEHLKVPIATAGVGYPGSRAHAPNENMRLDLFLNGTRHTARIIQMFAESG